MRKLLKKLFACQECGCIRHTEGCTLCEQLRELLQGYCGW